MTSGSEDIDTWSGVPDEEAWVRPFLIMSLETRAIAKQFKCQIACSIRTHTLLHAL